MRKLIFLILISSFPLISAHGQIVTEMDSSLLKNANAVINSYHIDYDVMSPGRITKREKSAITVLNQAGKDFGIITIYTGKGEKITSFSGTIKRNDGSVLSKLKLSSLTSRPSYPDYVFLSDDRVHYYVPVIEDYPYYVEYEQEISMDGMLAFDPWQPVSDEFVSCDTSSMSISYPSEYKIYYKSFNLPDEPGITKNKTGETITWQISKIPAVSLKSFAPPTETYLPCLYVMPEKFYYDGYPGEVNSWNTYGSWLRDIQKDRDEISPQLAEHLKSLVAKANDTKSKVEIIYKYLQKNTRYVAISLGIGGLQPAMASEIAKFGYGDCKGLSNYTKAMLAAVGIKSYYTVIGNGSKRIRYEDVPFFQTNHVILCVPDNNDTIWLECTSSDYNPGYIGYSNSNRKALLVTENGGMLVNTPRADSSNSCSINRYDLNITTDGSSSYSILSECSGKDYESLLYLKNASNKEGINYLYDNLPFRNHSIVSYTVSVDTTKVASLTAHIDGKFHKYATVAGKRLIVPLVPNRLFDRIPKLEPDRKADIFISKHTAVTDSILISIPETYTFKVDETDKEFSNEIGVYKQTIRKIDNKIVVQRKVYIKSGTYPVTMKDKVAELYKNSYDIEKATLVCDKIQ